MLYSLNVTELNTRTVKNKHHDLPRSTYQEDEIKQENEVF